MSGHSKWSTIKHQKEATDQARGKLFSKLSKAISVAIKTGGGVDPDTNYKLRIAIDVAKASNMPKANIERILAKKGEEGQLEEISYEGFGPEGIVVIALAATDNRNRTSQEIKGIFDRAGGHLAGPGAVSYNFSPRALILVKRENDIEGQMLRLIDLQVEEIEEAEDGIEVYVSPAQLRRTREKIENMGFSVISTELTQEPKSYQTIEDEAKATRVLKFLDSLSEHDDIQKVFANVDIPEKTLKKVGVN